MSMASSLYKESQVWTESINVWRKREWTRTSAEFARSPLFQWFWQWSVLRARLARLRLTQNTITNRRKTSPCGWSGSVYSWNNESWTMAPVRKWVAHSLPMINLQFPTFHSTIQRHLWFVRDVASSSIPNAWLKKFQMLRPGCASFVSTKLMSWKIRICGTMKTINS